LAEALSPCRWFAPWTDDRWPTRNPRFGEISPTRQDQQWCIAFHTDSPRAERVVDAPLKPPEIDSALAFYQSPAGIKYVEGLLRRMRERQGKESQLPEIPGKEEISPEELAKISDFSSTDLGRTLGKDFLQSPAAVAWGTDMTSQIARKCGGK
jgi:hypothetical protein